MKTMSKELYRELWLFIDAEGRRARNEMEQAAETMADLAERPKDIAFTGSVKRYKWNKERAEACQRLISQLEEIEPEDI